MKPFLILVACLCAAFAVAQQEPYRGQDTAKSNVVKGKPPITVSVNGTPVKFDDTPPQPVAGRMMVPLRGVFEAIGAYVEYDNTVRTITVRQGNKDIELRIGEKVARHNGAEVLLDVAPLLMKGHAMVPLRFLVETLGATLDFDGVKNHIEITTEAGKDKDKDNPPLAL